MRTVQFYRDFGLVLGLAVGSVGSAAAYHNFISHDSPGALIAGVSAGLLGGIVGSRIGEALGYLTLYRRR